jgi:hypothetical protein
MSPRTANRITAAAFAVLLLATCTAAGLAVHYRDAAQQARAPDCGRPSPAAPIPRRIQA